MQQLGEKGGGELQIRSGDRERMHARARADKALCALIRASAPRFMALSFDRPVVTGVR